MIIFCDMTECRNNDSGQCENVSMHRLNAVWIADDGSGNPVCTDYEQREDGEE